MDYLLHILILVCLYTCLAYSLDLVAGHTGLLSVAHAAFFGLGAYTSALLTTACEAPFVVGLAASAAIGAVSSLAVSLPSLRLRGDYFVIATFGFQLVTTGVLNNWTSLTRGPLGISAIPSPSLFGWRINTALEFALLAAAFAAIAFVTVCRLTSGGFGRVLHAVREDETFAQSLGKNTVRFKIVVFTVSAAIAAAAGSLYSAYISYIDPSSFMVMDSILIVSVIVVGGIGSRYGPLVGAVVIVALPEALRFIGLPAALAANIRQILYGAALVALMFARPRGIVGQAGVIR